jgi:hypothetical protein
MFNLLPRTTLRVQAPDEVVVVATVYEFGHECCPVAGGDRVEQRLACAVE